jgi:hypothetical protein
MSRPPQGYWGTNLYLDPRKRPKPEAPLRDLSPRAAQRFRKAREGLCALKHVTEQVVFLGTVYKWVWMYEVGGRKLAYLHPMESGASGTFVLTESEEQELAQANGLMRSVRDAMRDGDVRDGLRWCWTEFPDLDVVNAFVDLIARKHHFLARPE